MAGGLQAPRPQRRDTDLGRLLAALEVPDCGCRSPEESRRWMADPCRHERDFLARLGERPFPLTLEEWGLLLEAFDPEGYAEPQAPDSPAVAMTQKARGGVLRARAKAGLSLWHPDDVLPADERVEHLDVEAVLGKRQGEVTSAWHGEEDDPAEGLGGVELTRRKGRYVGDEVERRAVEFDRLAIRAKAANKEASSRQRKK